MTDTELELRVLAVDDEPDDLRVLLELLRAHRIEVFTALDGFAALRIAERSTPDLILLDIRMPRLDGFAVRRTLAGAPATAQLPVVFVTACDDLADKAQGFALGAVDYVTKPFDSREVLLRILSHARLARRYREACERLRLYEPHALPWQGPACSPLVAEASPAPAGAGLEPLPVPAGAFPPEVLKVLLRARDRLLAELRAPPDLEALARYAGTNRTTLERLFRQHLGLTVFGYLREQRLQQGRRLLMQTALGVEEVAHRVGYCNGRDFAHAFRRRFGVAPGALRPG